MAPSTIRYRDLEITVDGDSCTIAPFKEPTPPPPPGPLPPTPPPAWTWPKPTTGIFVAPLAGSAGAGTLANPMTLERALATSGAAQQIWLRGGTYNLAQTISPRLAGTAAAPWKISAYPGEEPTINVNTAQRHGLLFTTAAAYQEWAGLRFTDLSTGPKITTEFQLAKFDAGTGVGFAHCQFDNGKSSGLVVNGPAKDNWFYGCIFLNNGSSSQFDHGIYAKSRAGKLTVTNSFFANNAGHQFHGYNGSPHTTEAIRGMSVVDNSIFTYGEPSDRFVLMQDSGELKEARDCTITGNLCYNAVPGADATEQDRSTIKLINGVNARVEGNRIWGGDLVTTGSVTRGDNIIFRLGDWPGLATWVRPSKHDPGIAHVTIFNPAGAASVPVELAGKFPPGRYEIRAATSPQKVCASGSWSGTGPIAFPMSGLVYEPQVRTGGFNWRGSAKANGFILRRVP